MNKIFYKIIRIFSKIVLAAIILLLLIYISLWVYLNIFLSEELKNSYNQTIPSYLSEEQYSIIIYTYTENKNYGFKWYPFIIDIFIYDYVKKNSNNIAIFSARTLALEYFHNNLGKYQTMDWHIMNYGLMRYIIWNNDLKKNIDIITDNLWLGGDIDGIIIGLSNGSKYYFNKELLEMTNEELLSLIVYSISPSRYEIGSDENKLRVFEILREYNQ